MSSRTVDVGYVLSVVRRAATDLDNARAQLQWMAARAQRRRDKATKGHAGYDAAMVLDLEGYNLAIQRNAAATGELTQLMEVLRQERRGIGEGE